MSDDHPADARRPIHRHFLIGLIGAAGYCALSLLSYVAPLAMHLMVLGGLALPLVWGAVTRDWRAMGFRRRKLGLGLGWGLGAGLITAAIGAVVVRERVLPERWGLELAVGIPLWFLVASPFQELFFRGWLQSQWERGLGKTVGLVATTAVFTLWHYCWPLGARSSFPLHTLQGVAATFVAGLVYGYSFQRSGSIVAPWLGHALNGLAFLCMGAGSLVTALQQ